MELTIHYLPEDVNLKLKEKAKKAKLSKNAYILKLLETHVLVDEVEGLKKTYEEILHSSLAIIEENTKVMEKFIEINEGG
ncbi:hypothetical protein [Bacillus sp. Au-Bac7]|uniref:hypothetical protein n=1 Tax=Bacillus sp. Au-Bac7 TaxID=2906458 RepID=UPI001E3B6A63|nr:hypothetical protein [Bacillus sp. Au-Bac7]MCE4051670.1 hypothetical protein [Bacillus sp. Au-Bac7]